MKKKSLRNPPPAAVEPVPAWRLITVVTGCIWALFVTFKYSQKFPTVWSAPLDLLGDFMESLSASLFKVLPYDLFCLVLLAVLCAGCAAWGQLLLPRNEETPLSVRERLVMGLGLGFIFVSTLLFLLGLVGGYQRETLAGFLFVMTGVGLYVNRGFLPAVLADVKSISWSAPFLSPARILLSLFLFFCLLMAFVPELFYDSLVYHLGLPQMFVNEGRIVNTQNVYFSRFPLLVHMLYVVGVGLDGSAVPKLINASHFAVGLAAVWLVLKRLGSSKGTVWALLFLATLPVIQMNVWSTAIDVAQSAYAALALLTFLIWQSSPTESRRWLIITGLFAGASFATKYTGVVICITFGLGVVVNRRPNTSFVPRALANGALFSLMVFLVMSPYLIRNTIWTGNPTYPILSNHLESRHLNKERVSSEERLIARYKPKGVKGWLTFPWTQTMLEQTSFNYIGPMFLAGLPFLLLVPWKKSRDLMWVGGLTVVYFLVALQFSGDIRYLLPGFFILSVLLGVGFSETDRASKWAAGAAYTAFFAVGLFHLSSVSNMMRMLYKPAGVLTGVQSRQDYSATMHNGLNLWPWNTMNDVLTALPSTSRIYMLGNEQVFGFPRRFWYSSVHDYTPLVIWANESQDGEDFYQKLREQGFTHILYNVPESIRLRGYNLFAWNEQGRKSFVDFAQKHLRLLDTRPIEGQANALFLFEIKAPEDNSPLPFDFQTVFGQVLNLKTES